MAKGFHEITYCSHIEKPSLNGLFVHLGDDKALALCPICAALVREKVMRELLHDIGLAVGQQLRGTGARG